MYAIPPRLDGTADSRVAGVSCPACSGVLTVRAEGRRADLVFECRVGHTFTESEVLVALTADLAARDASSADDRLRYATRRAGARATAERLRRLIDEDEPIAFQESG